MATNTLGSVRLPAYITDPKRREQNLPAAPEIPAPPTMPSLVQVTPPTPSTPAEPQPWYARPIGPSINEAVDKYIQEGSAPSNLVPGMPRMSGTERGFTRALGETAEQAQTPVGLATLLAVSAATRLPPGPILSLIKAGISAQGIAGLLHSTPAAQEAFNAGDYEEGTRQLLHAAESGMMAAGAPFMKGRPPAASAPRPTLGQQMSKLGGEEGFITLEILDKFGNEIGTKSFQGPEVVPGGFVGNTPPGAKVKVVMRTPPSGREVVNALNWIEGRIPEGNIEFIDNRAGSRLPISQDTFMQVAHEASVPRITPPPIRTPKRGPAATMELGGGLPRTRSGRLSTVTDPFKLQKMEAQTKEFIDMAPPVEPTVPKVQPEVPTTPISYEEHIAQQTAKRSSATPPEPAASVAPAEGSYLERTLAAVLEQNMLMKQYIEALVSGKTAPTGAAPTPTPTGAGLPVPEKGVAPPPTPATPKPAKVPEGLEADIAAAMQQAPKIELTAAEKGFAPSTTKKGPVSYVGKTLEEKYAPTSPEARPSTAQEMPKTIEDFKAAVSAAEAGKGPQVFVVRRGLKGASPTRGWIRRNILDQRGRPTDRYEFMPENWSGDPFSIGISDIEFRGEKFTPVHIPRFPGKSFKEGIEVAAKAPAGRGEEFILPEGTGTGYKVGEEVTSAEDVAQIISRLSESKSPTAAKAIDKLKANLRPDGSLVLYRVFKGKGVQRVTAKHLGGPARKETEPTTAVRSSTSRFEDARKILEQKEYAKEGLKWDKATLDKVFPRSVTSDTEVYYPTDLQPVAKTLKPTTTKPSTKISRQTKLERKEVEKRMKAGGAERGAPAPTIPDEHTISAEAIAKAKGLVRPTPEITKQQIREKLMREAKSNPKKPGYSIKAEEPIKAVPPPSRPAPPPSKPKGPAVTGEAELAAKRAKAAEELKKLFGKGSKAEAKITEPPSTKGFSLPAQRLPDFSKMNPSQIRAWGEGQTRGAKLRGRSERRAAKRADIEAVLSESQRNILRGYLDQLSAIEKVEAVAGPTKVGDALRAEIGNLRRGAAPSIPPPPKQ